MASVALNALVAAVAEVTELKSVVKPKLIGQSADQLRIARAVGRAQVVLLSSHFERYVYAVNEEAITALNAQGVSSTLIPEKIKLIHAVDPIELMSKTSWDRRRPQLEQYTTSDAWLWSPNGAGNLRHERILGWMKAPKPESLVRYYSYWGIADIFSAITRKPVTRGRLWLGVQELVDMRNNIAHGDFAAQATQTDVIRYVQSVITFCERADRVFSRSLGPLCGGAAPW